MPHVKEEIPTPNTQMRETHAPTPDQPEQPGYSKELKEPGTQSGVLLGTWFSSKNPTVEMSKPSNFGNLDEERQPPTESNDEVPETEGYNADVTS